MWQNQPIIAIVNRWFRRNFSSPAAIALLFTIVVLFAFLFCFGGILLPVLISMVIAYILLPVVRGITRLSIPPWGSTIITYLIFIVSYIGVLFLLIPAAIRQLSSLINYIPSAFASFQAWLDALSHSFPSIMPSKVVMDNIAQAVHAQLLSVADNLLQFSLSTISGTIQLVLYLILVPVLVFFFLRDSKGIAQLISRLLPHERGLISSVWERVNSQLAAYVRGRILEVFIVGSVSCLLFFSFGMPYATLLGVLVGLSVIVPYVGAITVTLPVVLVGLLTWGGSSTFFYMLMGYLAIQAIDAYLLVPMIFSGAMDIHPIVIIVSIVFFGALFGFWGVFLAIPLASIIQTILYAWPQTKEGGSNQIDPLSAA